MRVLVVEDQKNIASFIKKGLEEEGMIIDVCHDGDEGYQLAMTEPYDALVLDIMLPGRDGLSILKNLRKKNFAVPVVILTARSELDERLEGLNLGADDYLSKPFYIEELAARLRTVIRRASGDATHILKVSDLTMDLIQRTVKRGEDVVDLSRREFSLLEYLMRTPGRSLTRTQITEYVWQYGFDPSTNLVDVYIKRLRQKVDQAYEEKLIQTVRGVGYRLGDPK